MVVIMYKGIDKELKLCDNRSVQIRKVQKTDTNKIKEFYESASETTCKFFMPHLFTNEVINQFIDKSLRGEDWAYLALDGEKAVAYFFLWGIKNPVTVLGIGITDEWQNCKLGQQLMNILIEDAKILDIFSIKLTTMLNNDKAYNMYLKKGFKYLGNVENVLSNGEISIERSMILQIKDET